MARTVAAVVGGSVAGLLAARVSSSAFERVLLFERDDLSEPGPRKGVPQANHSHVLLGAGSAVLSRLFPGLFAAIGQAGGLDVDMSLYNNWYHFGRWKRRFESGIRGHLQSRVLLEAELRQRVLALPNVLPRRGSVESISWPAGRPQLSVDGERIDVDFLVDASGRGSKLPEHFAAAGFERPREDSVVVDVMYTSARYARSQKRNWLGILLYPTPPHDKRAGAVLPLENGEVIVSLFGWCGERAGYDDAAFRAFAQTLPQPEIAEFLATATRTSDFHRYHYREARLRHFASLSQRPARTIAIGDALCSVDPVFGQGMTVAALSAEVLEQCLREPADDPSASFWARVPAAYRTAWELSTTEDFRYPEVSGHRPFGTRLAHWYTAQIHRLTSSDDDVYRRFAKVMHLMSPPSHLFHPNVLRKVLLQTLDRRSQKSEPRPHFPEAPGHLQ
jgi:2-polyprenyl-6-methoxyphenol hydroxylase-like FAD-dependent oxidoreductase